MRRCTIHCRFLIALLLSVVPLFGSAAVTDIQPRSCGPGETTRFTLRGKGLDQSLRVVTSCSSVEVQIEQADADKAIVALTLPEQIAPGPLGIWTATDAGPSQPMIVLVDELSNVVDNGKNHSPDTAQQLAPSVSVDGISDGAKSDFYRIPVQAGQRVAFEVLTQAIESPMDPVVRLLDADGQTLHMADDDAVGPECRFSHTFAEAGEVLLEVRDNRYLAGHRYHLRVGDFPIVQHAFPLAVHPEQDVDVTFATSDGLSSEVKRLQVDRTNVTAAGVLMIRARAAQGNASAWVPVHISPLPQSIESDSQGDPLAYPIGINGQLSARNEVDEFLIRGVKDQAVEFDSRTRSLGSAALLKMELWNEAGKSVAQTKVTESDEWTLRYTFPDNGIYRLRATDLLGRGGSGFGYWVGIWPAAGFSIGLKADAKLREEYLVEASHGAVALDLQIERSGYDGAIDLRLQDEPAGLRLINSRIAAKAKTAKAYIVVDDSWRPDSMANITLLAQHADRTSVAQRVTSLAVHRLKRPHVPFPIGWNDGTVTLSGSNSGDPYYSLVPEGSIAFARPLKKHEAKLRLKRTNKKFKASVSFLPGQIPSGWRVAVKNDKDLFTASFTESKGAERALSTIPLQFYSEFDGRGRLENVEVPVEWIDPLRIGLEMPRAMVAGTTVTLVANIEREGDDPQPVTIRWTELPDGVSAAEPSTIAADQQRVELKLVVAADAVVPLDAVFALTAASQYQGQEFSIEARSASPLLIASPQRLQVNPSELELRGKRDQRQLIVTGYSADGTPRDWTHDVTIRSANPRIAEVRGSVVVPRGDGETEILVQHGSHSEIVLVRVAEMQVARSTQFESEVLVALSKQGCNSGACHGSPSGKGMFRLSLRAFDRSLDELTLIREEAGRRVNRIDPEQSLLLVKPLMKVTHGGGKKLHKSDPAYAILRDWIAEGAQADPPDVARCVRLEVFPSEKRVLKRVEGGQQLAVLAHFSDGSMRDVTNLVAYESSSPGVATVDESGRVTPHQRGESVILVRFLEHIESVPMMFVEQVSDFVWKAPPAANYIDRLVHEKLRQLQFLPAETCTDSEFLRRVYLDVIGILPTVPETEAFLDDPHKDKRARLIDRLLQRDEYARFWALKWGDLLKMTSKTVGDEGVHKYHRWVEEALRSNMPYDEFARRLLTASGSTLANPPANFYRAASDMNECVETISQVFLGARLQCAKCHNHPFERWTQDNYYGLGAFFQRIERRQTQRPGEIFVWTSTDGEVIQPRTGEQMEPWLPKRGSIDVPDGEDRRQPFVDWLIDAENPYFARIGANRIWSQLFSRGIVDPVDDFRDSNPPVNGPLLDALADDFASSGFDNKHLLRTILNSRTYQASYRTNQFNEEDSLYFSHQQPRMLTAEQLLDAVNHTAGLTPSLGNLPAGTKATSLPAPDLVDVDFLKVFGQSERSTVCACERSDDSNLGMAIELFNGSSIHEKLRDSSNRFRRALAADKPIESVLRELYLAALCRPPTDDELQAMLAHCEQRKDTAAGLEDICWALINTDEFLFQH